jgi:ABC-2 type transport system permease protein
MSKNGMAGGPMNNADGAGGPVTWSLVATAAITLVFAPLTLHLYGKQR